ncbi:MAG TPA: hypothetical protein PLJ29_03440, partial [Leptospiraceae bacterium]|nr:hypothetical protein [Leptospiraceae bacterium]
ASWEILQSSEDSLVGDPTVLRGQNFVGGPTIFRGQNFVGGSTVLIRQPRRRSYNLQRTEH